MTQGTSRHDPADPTLPLDPDEDAAWRALARAVIVVPRVLDAADRYAGMGEEQRQAAVDAMAGEDVIFPMAG